MEETLHRRSRSRSSFWSGLETYAQPPKMGSYEEKFIFITALMIFLAHPLAFVQHLYPF